jgi:hypothetical protein
MSVGGTSLHFAATLQFGRFRSEAEIELQSEFMSTRPKLT